MVGVAVHVLMDLPPQHPYHVATLNAIHHASVAAGIPAEARVVQTDSLAGDQGWLSPGSAIVVGPGSPYRDQDGVHRVIKTARERGIPLVGT